MLDVVIHGDVLTQSDCVNTEEPDFKAVLLGMPNFRLGCGFEGPGFETL